MHAKQQPKRKDTTMTTNMEAKDGEENTGMSRRDMLTTIGAVGAGLAAGGVLPGQAAAQEAGAQPMPGDMFRMKTVIAQPALFYYPGEELAADEIRVSVMGSGWGNMVRKRQACCSLFIELGNGDSYVWDLGLGTLINYNTMQVPYSRMTKVFLTHLHADHTSDLVPLWAFGPAGDRFTPLRIWGPSGDRPELGVKYMMETGLKAFTNWHVTSFRTVVPGSSQTTGGYGLEVTELDYRKSGGIAYQENGVTIKYWPALHTINGAIGYRLEWNGMSVVWSGDTNPSHIFVENNKQGADLMFHETAPIPERIVAAGFPKQLADAIVNSSHTPPRALGKIFALTKPNLGVTIHSAVDPQEVSAYLDEVRVHWKGPYQLVADDLMVFNIHKGKNTISIRQAAVNERAWNVRVAQPSSTGANLSPADYRSASLWANEIKDY
jgi:ribonuclease Z